MSSILYILTGKQDIVPLILGARAFVGTFLEGVTAALAAFFVRALLVAIQDRQRARNA
jgi:hypothetical protein